MKLAMCAPLTPGDSFVLTSLVNLLPLLITALLLRYLPFGMGAHTLVAG